MIGKLFHLMLAMTTQEIREKTENAGYFLKLTYSHQVQFAQKLIWLLALSKIKKKQLTLPFI
jgi:hypothetical protein